MTMATGEAGVACCGNCGAEAHVVCSAGCENPDVEIREHPISSLPVPRGEEKPRKQPAAPRSGFCKCGEPVAIRQPGRGRPPAKCEKHIAQQKASRDRWNAKQAAR